MDSKSPEMVCERPDPRRLFMVLSPRSLPYATLAFKSLFLNAVERVAPFSHHGHRC